MAQQSKLFMAVDSFVGTCTPRSDIAGQINNFLAKISGRRVVHLSTSAATVNSSSLSIFYALLLYEDTEETAD